VAMLDCPGLSRLPFSHPGVTSRGRTWPAHQPAECVLYIKYLDCSAVGVFRGWVAPHFGCPAVDLSALGLSRRAKVFRSGSREKWDTMPDQGYVRFIA